MIKTIYTEYFIEIYLVLPIITITSIRLEPLGPSSVHQNVEKDIFNLSIKSQPIDAKIVRYKEQ